MTMIRCEDVKKYFSGKAGPVKAVDEISLQVEKGDTFGIVNAPADVSQPTRLEAGS